MYCVCSAGIFFAHEQRVHSCQRVLYVCYLRMRNTRSREFLISYVTNVSRMFNVNFYTFPFGRCKERGAPSAFADPRNNTKVDIAYVTTAGKTKRKDRMLEREHWEL